MDLLDRLYVTDVLHGIAEFLLIPTVILLIAFVVYSLYSIGSIIVEIVVERRRYRAKVPRLVALIEECPTDDLQKVIDESGLLRYQKDDLDELVCYLYLPEDGRTEVAKRLLANEDMRNQKVLDRTEMAAKTAPMLGLMGTLIPLGPGIIALGTGDVETLSNALLMAFDTTVAGLATAVVCFVISRIRRRWYADYLVSMEAAFNAVLEKARIADEAGYVFPKGVLTYDKAGRNATFVPLGPDGMLLEDADGGEGDASEDASGEGASGARGANSTGAASVGKAGA